MTDAAVAITQSAVETFAHRYLRSVGCSINKQSDNWVVSPDGNAETELISETTSIAIGDEALDDEDTTKVLHPESSFFQELLTEASERSPTGKIAIDAANSNVDPPSWLQNDTIEITDTQFTPYYDRTAIVVLFQVRIETVSEYQTELLRAVAMDLRSQESLPKLEKTVLEQTSIERAAVTADRIDIAESDIGSLVQDAGDVLVERVQPQIDEIHEEASRASDAEVEEYRQMQEQRIEELEEEQASLSLRIDELNAAIERSDQSERMELLQERKEKKSEYEEIEEKLADLRQRRDQGFPERQREIRDRHAIDVRLTPLTVTQVEYERGEVTFKLEDRRESVSVTVGYGSGVGMTEQVKCDICSQALTDENPIQAIEDGIQCSGCKSHASDR